MGSDVMKHDQIALAVKLSGEGEPPSEFRIFTKGEVRTRKGKFLFDDESAAAVTREALDFGNEFPLDYAHSMFSALAPNPAEAHKAAGWFRPEVRDGELWACDVTWTPAATSYLKNREYRYVSPTFEHEDKRIKRLINVALTNVPATHKLKPLMAHSLGDECEAALEQEGLRLLKVQLGLPAVDPDGPDNTTGLPSRATAAAASAEGDNDMKTVALAVGLPSEAAESEVLSRITLHREITAEVQKVTGKDNAREALGTILAWKEETTKLDAAQKRVAELESTVRLREVEEKVEEKIRTGFLEPARRDFAVELGMSNDKMFTAYLDGLTSKIVNREEVANPRHRSGSVDLDIDVPPPAELARLGVTAETYVQTTQLMLKEGSL